MYVCFQSANRFSPNTWCYQNWASLWDADAQGICCCQPVKHVCAVIKCAEVKGYITEHIKHHFHNIRWKGWTLHTQETLNMINTTLIAEIQMCQFSFCPELLRIDILDRISEPVLFVLILEFFFCLCKISWKSFRRMKGKLMNKGKEITSSFGSKVLSWYCMNPDNQSKLQPVIRGHVNTHSH